MAKANIGHGRVTTPRLSGVAGPINASPKPGDIAEQICATAYRDGKTEGVYAATLDVLARRLVISRPYLNEGMSAGIGAGWLRPGTGAGQVELTAAGIYIAKLSLKLPT
jgi:hypothetical protein